MRVQVGRWNQKFASIPSRATTLSPVREAMGVAAEVGMGAIRFSLGRGTTRDEIEAVIERLNGILVVAS
jgi:cysteine sulfinate desulfinase/cysteine desulfurase-like protein